MKLDRYGLIVGTKEDPGDSCHRVCMWYLGLMFAGHTFHKKPIDIALANLEKRPGRFIRHPSPGWWSDLDRLSRDQLTPLVILLFELKNFRALKPLLWGIVRRCGFLWNTRRNGATRENDGTDKYPGRPEWGQYDYSWKPPDIIGPKIIGLFIRGSRMNILYPLLCLLDLEIVFAALRHRSKKHTDVLNHLITSRYAVTVTPTFVSRFAWKLNDPAVLTRKLKDYFDRVGLPEMYELWRDLTT